MNPNDGSLPRLPSFAGIKSKMQLSRDFLKRKLDEYEMFNDDLQTSDTETTIELNFSLRERVRPALSLSKG